jgi:hypothetical protein
MNTCTFCNRIINNKGSLIAHSRCCKHNPNKIKYKRSKLAGRKKGSTPWNKNKKFHDKSMKKLKETIESGKYHDYTDNAIRRLIKQYLIHKYGHKCMLCNTEKWMGHIIPLVCDHIDGDPNNNQLINFRIICNNCDSILPTFKGKNKGNGRKQRYNRTI